MANEISKLQADKLKKILAQFAIAPAKELEKNKIKRKYTNIEIGFVVGIADGIVSIKGLDNVANGEMIFFMTPKGNVRGLVLNLEITKVSAVVLGTDTSIKPGQVVLRLKKLMSINASKFLLGRIIDPIGNPLDGLKEPIADKRQYVEKIAPSIILRSPVNTPLESGLKVVDSLVPVGHGQRELIIGDSKTGKTSIAIDTILNQIEEDTINIYVAIGQKRSSIARIAKLFREQNCLNSTIIVAATASDSAALQYIAPYSGCSIGEYFMDKGLRVLIIYDDLSKHAVSYRQLSLLLRRPPGREGYPGDVFFLHSRLLERSANLKSGGSLTALPIIETIQGDVSAYIPTNVISITDGQIFLETELFSKGIRPAVSPGLSVSRVGSAAQTKILKKMAGSLKLDLAQFREVEAFTKLGFALEDATMQLIQKGGRLTSILIQGRNKPVYVQRQILFLFIALNGYLDWMNSKYTSVCEIELFKLWDNSPFGEIFKTDLKSELDVELIGYFAWYFSDGYIKYLNKYHNLNI